MRIATWNLDHAKHPDKLQQVMDRQNADIWILTETRPQATPGEGHAWRRPRLRRKLVPGTRLSSG